MAPLQNAQFCASIKKRPECLPLLKALLTSKDPVFKGLLRIVARLKNINQTNRQPGIEIFHLIIESASLQCHDLTIPFRVQSTFRILLVAEDEVTSHPKKLLPRLHHFASLTGGTQCVVLFLPSDRPRSYSHQAYQTLQEFLFANDIDLLTIFMPGPASLLDIVKALTAEPKEASLSAQPAPQVFDDILPYCSLNQPISSVTLSSLADVAPSLRRLAIASQLTPDTFVEGMVNAGVDAIEAEACLEFWRDEYLPE